MHDRPPPGRPRPVADPVVAALAERPDEVARRWVVSLLEDRPLEEAATLPLADLARSGPALCRAVLEAIGSDAALDALPGEHAPALLAAAGRGGPAVVSAAEALRRAVCESAAGELPRSETEVLADLTNRAAHVCARLAATAMTIAEARPRAAPEAAAHEPEPALFAPSAGSATDSEPARGAAEPDPARSAPDQASEPVRSAPDPEPARFAPDQASEPVRSAPDPEPARSAPEAVPGAAPLWVAALERQLADGGRFGLLLVELDGTERLWLSEGEDGARELFSRTGRAVRGELRRGDLLAHERDGRLWVIAPDMGRLGATALAVRVAAAVEGAASARGVPLTASVGLALYPDDGRDADSLTGQAEEQALAARAAGVRVLGESPEPPAASGPRLVH